MGDLPVRLATPGAHTCRGCNYLSYHSRMQRDEAMAATTGARMKTVMLGVLLLFVPLTIATAAEEPRSAEPAAEAPAPPPRYDLRTLQAELRRVVQRHYPGCTSHALDGKIYFERDT